MDDIDALQRELRQTRLAYRSAIALADWKGSFFGRTAHELRSPLSSLISLHQLILADLCENPEEEREFIERAHQSSRKLLALLDEIIILSKLESGNIPLDRQPVSLAELFQDLERLTHLQAANRNLKLDIPPIGSEIAILADFRRLSNALGLVIDAAIARADRGTIRIAGESTDGETVTIALDLPCPVTLWQEELETPIQDTIGETISRLDRSLSRSPGFRFEMLRNLVALLDGRIEYREMADPFGGEPITRIDCSLPRSPL